MSQPTVTPRDALLRLGASTAEAVARALEMFLPGQVERGEVSVLPDSESAFSNTPTDAVAASVSYVDGVTGANVFLMTQLGARTLATTMGVPPPESEEEPLSELELSAVAEAANQMMAAAASAIGVVLGQEIEISPPDTRVLDDTINAIELYGKAPHATSTTFLIGKESCRLIQLVPSAFVVRMVRAIDEQRMEEAGALEPMSSRESAEQDDEQGSSPVGLQQALSEIRLRVWAELGRTQIPLGDALELPVGALVDLDCAANSPVSLYVNGLCFAQGHLLITDEGEWAVCLEALRGSVPQEVPAVSAQPQLEGALT